LKCGAAVAAARGIILGHMAPAVSEAPQLL
jgi:hypothetical protein